MSNIELIEDYLANRLSAADKASFEQQMQSDSSLKSDVDLQKHIIEGIQRARAAELKTMLNNVPIGGSSLTSTATVAKIAAVVAVTGIVGFSVYHYLTSPSNEVSNIPAPVEQRAIAVDSLNHVKEDNAIETTSADTKTESIKKSTTGQPEAATKKEVTPSTSSKPALDITDPSDELDNKATTNKAAEHENQKSVARNSRIVVITNASDKKYDFHYQFNGGKLILFGSFARSLYEILEIHGDSHAVFLYYKETYYLLDEKREAVTALKPITDAALLKKLKDYRESK